ncbi:MAG: DUF1080 domain-containing protein [Planctomycetaceae bacterium]|jgi:hypothetical protein|nr:DUF1080 domain-containing protein [Planctomycetaceae bacterium]MBT6486706.1 DUF1080 domain-containing protein [Planctomycetaceae bacterium]MBT6494063.1 DUF1080 domain-containing protein [Planctomycetaceae bacterium]
MISIRLYPAIGRRTLFCLLAGWLAFGSTSVNHTATAGEKSDQARWSVLFNGEDLDGWKSQSDDKTGNWTVAGRVPVDESDAKKFSIHPGKGVLVNGDAGRTSNLFTKHQHADVEAHIEFVVPRGSNSGIYFQGRYEIQVLDSFGVKKPKYSDCGGIYQRWAKGKGFEGHAPKVNVSKAPGEWQTFDVVFRAPRFDKAGKKIENGRFIKVVHNGVLIHQNVEVTGPTRAAAFGDEKATGPIMLQGDHGPVAYRNLKIRPIKLP